MRKRWTYKVIEQDFAPRQRAEAIQRMLHYHGHDGWELVSFFEFEPGEFRAVFKQLLEPGTVS